MLEILSDGHRHVLTQKRLIGVEAQCLVQFIRFALAMAMDMATQRRKGPDLFREPGLRSGSPYSATLIVGYGNGYKIEK